MSASGFLSMDLRIAISQQPAAGVGGGEIVFGRQMGGRGRGGLGFGVGAGRWNRSYYYDSQATGNTGLLTTAARSLDLQTQTDRFGVALGLEEVGLFAFYAHHENSYNIEIKPNGVNGWTGLLKDASDIIQVPGGTLILINALSRSVALAVSGSNKVLDLANATSSTQQYELLIIGRDTA